MTNSDIQNASAIMLGSTEIEKLYIGNSLIYKRDVPAFYSSPNGAAFVAGPTV